jgi:hypothetical protein
MTERVIVRTGDDQSLSDLAAALIGLADDPHEVVFEHRGGYLTVPEYVAARYADGMDATDTDPAGAEVDENGPETATADVVATPVKRKPGRPRKNVPVDAAVVAAVVAAVKEEVN